MYLIGEDNIGRHFEAEVNAYIRNLEIIVLIVEGNKLRRYPMMAS